MSCAASHAVPADDQQRIWLASYPRSGNTMLRYLLNQVFDLKTTSLYDGDTRLFGAVAGVPELVGHYDRGAVGHGSGGPSGYAFVKTHEPPIDSGPAIYIVRDGRSALVSYMHYLRRAEGVAVDLPSIIKGEVWPGSWSELFSGGLYRHVPGRWFSVTRN